MTFSEILTKLNNYIVQRRLPKEVIIDREIFDHLIDSYELKAKALDSSLKRQSCQNKRFKFLVAE